MVRFHPDPLMSKAGETFFTSIGCMDGRVQEPVLTFGKEKFGVLYADTITEAGLVGVLSKKNIDKRLLSSLKKKILISLEKHHSKGIIIHGHQECAGNPVDDEIHRKDVLKSAKIINSLISGILIIPVFVIRKGENWIVEKL